MNKLGRVLFACFLTLAAVLAFSMGMRSGNPYLMSVPVLIPVVIYGVSRPEVVFLFTMAIMNSKLVLPGFPGDLELYHVTLAFAVMVMIIRETIVKERLVLDPWIRWTCLAYGCIVFGTMMARGIGFRMLGSVEAGGMRYVLIYLGVLSIWFLPNINVSPRGLKTALVCYATLSFFPVLAEVTLLASGGRFYQQYYFVKTGFGLGDTFSAFEIGQGTRFTSASILGRGLIYLPFFLFPFRNKYKYFYAGMICLGLFFVTYSGFRSVLVSSCIFLAYILFTLLAGYRKRLIFFSMVFAASAFVLLYLTYDYLPYGVQRTVSFLPYISEGNLAIQDARGSTDFRLGTWEIAAQRLDEYLWLGRGATYSLRDVYLLSTGPYLQGLNYMHGWVTNLHNGPLEVLVFFGIPGALAFAMFLSRTLWKLFKSIKFKNPLLEADRLSCVFEALTFSSIMLFLASVGNSYGTFLNICLNLSVIFIIKTSLTSSKVTSEANQRGPVSE